jgi:hypothetical protein|tara:strand:+ start:264 stop:596 length:333 start_codon:yes stop_codon:yes gene_type:complete
MNKQELKHLIKEELKNAKAADLNKDGELSSYEEKRGAAIEKNLEEADGEMDEDMREFRELLSDMDGQQSELEYSLRQISLKDSGLEMELEDALTSLETIITEIQESEGWI